MKKFKGLFVPVGDADRSKKVRRMEMCGTAESMGSCPQKKSSVKNHVEKQCDLCVFYFGNHKQFIEWLDSQGE